MSVPNPNPNAATVGGMFSQADLEGGGGGNTVLVEEGSYQLLLSANANKKNGGIVFVEGVIQAGIHAGKEVKVFTVVFHKKPGQKQVGVKNLTAIGLSPDVLNGIQLQSGAVEGGDLMPLYEAVAAYVTGRVVNAELVLNNYDNAAGAQTDMQVKVGAMTLLGAPAAPAIGAAPGIPAIAAAPPPPAAAVAAAAPPVAPVAAAAPPVVAPPQPPAVPQVEAVVPVAAAAPAAEVGVATPASPVAPVAPPQPPEVAAVPVAPAPGAGTVPVVGEPNF